MYPEDIIRIHNNKIMVTPIGFNIYVSSDIENATIVPININTTPIKSFIKEYILL